MAAKHEHTPFNNMPNTLSIMCTALSLLTGWELTVGKREGEDFWLYVLRAPDGSAQILRRVDGLPCS